MNDPSPETSADLPVTFDDVRQAARRLRGVVRRTPVLTCRALDDELGMRLAFKCEHMQRAGAFKFRGASNAVAQLTDEQARRGVATHSSGNHGAALAMAAQQRQAPAHIVVPESASPVKVKLIEQAGGRITFCAPTLDARRAAAARVGEQTGATLIPPCEHPHIIAGQGTAALELLEDHGEVDVLVAPVGGGGLLSGTSLAGHGVHEQISIVGAEPEQADDAHRSLRAGHIIENVGEVGTIADGLKTSLGPQTFRVIAEHVSEIVCVSEAQIIDALRLLRARAGAIVEPSAAVALAAAVKRRREWADKRVGIILSGGNVDLETLPWQT